MSSIRKSSRTRVPNDALLQSSAKFSDLKRDQHRTQLLDECTYPRTGRRGAPQIFPRKLYQILEEEDESVIAWTNSKGTSFTIHDMDYFTEHVLLNYFRHQKYSSFQRQLNLYGFHKICKGPETGAYAHDCFLRGRPDLLMGVRRLPQRVAAAVSKMRSKGNNKIVIKRRFDTSLSLSKPQGAFEKLASCMKPRSHRRLHESSSDYDSNSSDGEEEGDETSSDDGESAPRVPPPPPGYRDIVEDSVDSVAQSEEIDFFGFSDGTSEEYTLGNLEEDGIVRFQPLPKECIIDSSAKVVDGISKGVNQMMLERSPIAMAKTVKVSESSRSWAVQKFQVPLDKPQSPNSALQRMIPMLVRAGSSAFATGKDAKLSSGSCDEDMMKSVIDDLQNIDASSALTRSKSMLLDTMQSSKEDSGTLLSMPSALNQRLSSEAWNLEPVNPVTDQELQQFFAPGQLDSIFARQESCDLIVPPKPVEMER